METKTTEQQEIDRIAEKLIREEIYAHVSAWVEASFEKGIFACDDIENFYGSKEEEEDGDSYPKEIFQWFIISPFIYEYLQAIGEPVMNNDYGYFWGRTCCGQAIELDGTFQEIAKNIMERVKS